MPDHLQLKVQMSTSKVKLTQKAGEQSSVSMLGFLKHIIHANANTHICHFFRPKNSLLLEFGKTDPAFDISAVRLKDKGDSKEFASLQLPKEQNLIKSLHNMRSEKLIPYLMERSDARSSN